MTKAAATTTKKEILVTGFGGQGVVLIGSILGKAAALGDHRESTQVQSYGPESRGGYCCSQIIIDDKQIQYPYVRRPDILVCMSQTGYDKYSYMILDTTMLIIDQDLVKPTGFDRDYLSIPATRLAEEMGRKMIANIVMLGFFSSVTQAVSRKSVEEAVKDSVPKGTEEMNLNAFKKGWDYGAAMLKGREKKAAGHAGVAS